jgi:hypothetical protein
MTRRFLLTLPFVGPLLRTKVPARLRFADVLVCARLVRQHGESMDRIIAELLKRPHA